MEILERRREVICHGKIGYREPKGIITKEYIAQTVKKLKVGDRITWMLPVIDRSSPTLSRVLRRRRLTVAGKTPHLIIAEDANGKMHTIRTAEWAAEEWRKKCHAGKNDE